MTRKSLLAAGAILTVAAVQPFATTEAAAATQSRSCAVDNVAVIDGRMHIKCAPIQGQAYTGEIRHYALPLTEPVAKVQALVMLAVESKRINKPLVVWFDMADYQSVPGCLGHDCRRLKGAALE